MGSAESHLLILRIWDIAEAHWCRRAGIGLCVQLLLIQSLEERPSGVQGCDHVCRSEGEEIKFLHRTGTFQPSAVSASLSSCPVLKGRHHCTPIGSCC